MLKIIGIASLLTIALCNTASAGKALSWNLSRDMIKGITINPKGVWAFMENTTGVDNPTNYTMIPQYFSPCLVETPSLKCWRKTNANGVYPIVGVATKTFDYRLTTQTKGVPLLHPGLNIPVILRWTSPINGKVNILGRVSDIDYRSNTGDGINWSLKNNNASIIRSGSLANGEGATFSAQNITMLKGESLYFTVDMKNDLNSDSTNLDIIITNQQ